MVYITVAVQEAVGVKTCSREDPERPHPLQAQLPPESGSGLKVTCVPELAVTLALCVRAPPLETNGVMVVALHVPEGGGVPEEPPPPQPVTTPSTRDAAR